MAQKPCYNWDEQGCADVVRVGVIECLGFISLLKSYLPSDYRFLSRDEVIDQHSDVGANRIGDGLFGGISEFACYVIRCAQEGHRPPLIHCFRAAHPLGAANFPYVDVGVFVAGATAGDDQLHMQEIKATRDNPDYFRKAETDYSDLYTKCRLNSTVEHMKYDLKMARKRKLIPRINDCVGTSPADSLKISLNPTGVSAKTVPVDQCEKILQGITTRLRKAGWPIVRAINLQVPDIEGLYIDFATGGGVRS